MKVGFFGGSFDPIHLGHVAAAEAALVALRLERVEFVPTARPPHKVDRPMAPALARFAMVELALLDRPEMVVSAAELGDAAASYTIETLERRRAERPGDELHLLLGADSLAQLHTWRRWEELVRGYPIGVLARPGFELVRRLEGVPTALATALAGARLTWIDLPAHPASASEIRARLARGVEPPAGWLDPRVLTFARKYRLYR